MKFPVLEPKYGDFTVKDKVLLGEYMDEITSSTFQNPSRYLFSIQIPNKFPEILADLEPHPTYWAPNWLESKYLLPGLPQFKLRNITGLEMNIGGTGSQFPFLHFDDLLTQTFVTQVHGRKAWILWTPDQTPYMYPSKESDNISQIPMDSPEVDLSKFPLFVHAKPLRFILEAGEMLYTASGGWWHTTRALSPSIAVVLSTANGPIWSQVTRSAFAKAWKHRRWYFRPAAFPIAAYMTGFRAVKSLTDPF
jgi:histone arginine demethylase JMJD6